MASTEDTAAEGADVAPGEGMNAFSIAASALGAPMPNDVAGPTAATAVSAVSGKAKKKRPPPLDWELAKELPLPEGESNPWNGASKDQPVPITASEKICIAKESNPLFPIGFYNLTSAKRGVTKGRGQWKGKETLCLLYCSADKSGCPFKARFVRTSQGLEIWTSGEHNVSTHKTQPKRGLNSEARAFVTKNHDLGQGQLLEHLQRNGLIPADCSKEELIKIKSQIKRRRHTVKGQISKEKLVVASMRAPKVEKERAMEAANRNAVGVIVAAGGLVHAREEQERMVHAQMIAEEAMGHAPMGPPPMGPPPPPGVLRQMMMDPEAAAAAAAAAEEAAATGDVLPVYPVLPHHI